MSAFLDKEHPDITYLKQDDIGLVLSKGLSETYKVKPKNPVEFFAKWLLNYSKTQKQAQQDKEREKVVKDLKEKNQYFIKAKIAEKEEEEKEEGQKQQKIESFIEKLSKSEDLSDNLKELADYLQTFTNATGVYIGKLIQPRKKISDEDDEKAHIDEENPKVICFDHASKGHEFMIEQILKSDQGISHDVFKEGEAAEAEEGEEPLEEAEGEEGEKKAASQDILQTFKHIYVKEVVRENRMHFYRVPKLGCFMAVPLIYFSCSFEEALDKAVEDFIEVGKRKDEQQKAIDEWEEERAREKEEKEKAGDFNYEPEKREWDPINPLPFHTVEEKYVVCVDTMGQDRELGDEQKRFILNTIKTYKEMWEQREIDNLSKDRSKKLQSIEQDKEFLENEATRLVDEEDKFIEDFQTNYREGELPDEELKDLETKEARLHFTIKQFKERDEWKRNLFEIKDFKVLKMPRVMQSLFYILKYEREPICEKDSNKFFWKKAKEFINEEFLGRLEKYKVIGPKSDQYKKYQTINFIEKNVESISPEDVDSYNLTIGRLFKWLLTAIKTRKEDIIRRKALRKKASEEREHLISQAEARIQKKENELLEAQEKFKDDHKDEIEAVQKWEDDEKNKGDNEYGNEDDDDEKDQKPKEKPVLPEFNEEEFLNKWVEENPEIEIPEETQDEQDNDWELTEEDEEQLISQYLSQKEAP